MKNKKLFRNFIVIILFSRKRVLVMYVNPKFRHVFDIVEIGSRLIWFLITVITTFPQHPKPSVNFHHFSSILKTTLKFGPNIKAILNIKSAYMKLCTTIIFISMCTGFNHTSGSIFAGEMPFWWRYARRNLNFLLQISERISTCCSREAPLTSDYST